MDIEIIGEPVFIHRVNTGLYTLDRACINTRGDIGFPVGTIIQFAGSTGVGKSTSVYSLSGMLANMLETNISLADFEGFDAEYLLDVLKAQGYKGKLHLIQKETDEDALGELIEDIKSEKYGMGIVDSVGAISPISEKESDLGEANMGRRAFLTNQFSRKMMSHLRYNKKNVFMINHLHADMGGFGMRSPGGTTMKYLFGINVRMKRAETYDDGSFVVVGNVRKNKFGLGKRNFFLFILAGKGIHKGLTAVWDSIILKKATLSRTVKIGEKSYGYMKDIISKADDEELFQDFYELLEN